MKNWSKHQVVRKNLEFQYTSNFTNIVDKKFNKKDDFFLL